MSMNRTETWLALIVLGVGLVLAFVAGLWGYMSATSAPLHPNPQDVKFVARAAPLPAWSGAAETGRRLVRAHLVERNLPGLSVAVGVGGEIVWAEGAGWADLEKREPVAPETRFLIGTASIALTSAAVGLLLETGRMKLDENIQTYVPEYPAKPWPVTLRQLMGHTAGVPRGGGDEDPMVRRHCERAVDALSNFSKGSLAFEPGTQYRYSQLGWILVSAALEDVADEPYSTFMRKQIFEPLGMNDTKADSTTEAIPSMATSYFPRFMANPRYGPDLVGPRDQSCYAGSGAFLSTPTDLVRFAMAINSGKLLQPATVKLFQTSQRLPSGQETGYGLGWDLETATIAGKPTQVIGHDGDSIGGMIASFMTFPEYGIVVAVTSNIAYADTFSLAVRIADAFAEKR